MNALTKPTSIEDFIAWEDRQELRHEFDGVLLRAITGGTEAHSSIQTNLIAALRGGASRQTLPCAW